MAEGMARCGHRWRGALGLGAALALAACAPLPVATPDGSAAGAVAPCVAESGSADACPPAAVRTPPAPAPGSVRGRRAAPAIVAPPPPAPDVPAAEAPSEPARESDQQGLASWYGPGLHGRRTASGERFDRYELTAAHRTLPFGSRVCVRSAVTGKTVVVRINDRGPFSGGRVIDLSQAAAQELGMTGLGIKPVQLWLLGEDEDTCPDGVLENPVLAKEADAAEDAAARAEAAAARKPAVRKALRSRNARR